MKLWGTSNLGFLGWVIRAPTAARNAGGRWGESWSHGPACIGAGTGLLHHGAAIVGLEHPPAAYTPLDLGARPLGTDERLRTPPDGLKPSNLCVNPGN